MGLWIWATPRSGGPVQRGPVIAKHCAALPVVRVPGDAHRRGVVLGGQPADPEDPVLAGHPVDQVIDLFVGLADDHHPLALLGEEGGGRDHQG